MVMITIITPTRDRAGYLRQMVESVAAGDFPDIEHIIIDDASSDGTEKAVRELKKRYPFIISLKNKERLGISGSKNRALKIARGKYVADIDDDDILPFYSLSLRLKVLQGSGRRWVMGNAYQIDEHGRLLKENLMAKEPADISDFIEGRTFAFAGTKMYYRKDLQDIGGWNEAYPIIGEDYELWLRYTQRFGVPALSRIPLIFYRKKKHSTGIDAKRSGEMDRVIHEINEDFMQNIQGTGLRPGLEA